MFIPTEATDYNILTFDFEGKSVVLKFSYSFATFVAIEKYAVSVQGSFHVS